MALKAGTLNLRSTHLGPVNTQVNMSLAVPLIAVGIWVSLPKNLIFLHIVTFTSLRSWDRAHVHQMRSTRAKISCSGCVSLVTTCSP
jgi:hypothetical protein